MPPNDNIGTVPLDPNDPDNLAKLTDEQSSPTSPAEDVGDTGADHQQKDTNVDSHEAYDEGEDLAAGVSDPLKNGPPADFSPNDPSAEGFDADGTEET